MTFANPAALLVLLTIPLLLLLRSVRRPRGRHVVPSLLLWESGSPPRPSWAFLRRLPVDFLLLLQILFLLLVGLALAGPRLTWWQTGVKRVALVLDTSASMQASDVFPSRFDAARAEALTTLGRLEAGREVSVVEAGVRPVLHQAFTTETERARAALNRLTPQDGTAAIRETLALLDTLAEHAPLEVHLFTDGAFDPVPWSPGEGWVFRVHRVGVRSHNVAITNFRIRKSYYTPARYELFVGVINFAPETLTFPFVLTLDGKPLHTEQVTLPARTRRGLVIPIFHRGGGVVEGRVEVVDDLAVDNRASAVIPPPRALRVLLVSQGNLFVENALKADPRIELTTVNPEAFPQARAGQDVVVLDNYSPNSIPPGRYLLIRSVPGNAPIEVLGTVRAPRIVDWDRSHPVMRYLDLAQVVIDAALKVRSLAGGDTLMESQLTPLALAFHEGGYRLVFLGFNPLTSDFPLRAAFPLFVSNALRWLYPTGIEDLGLDGGVGVPRAVALDPTLEQLALRGPRGDERSVPILNGRAYLPGLRRAGVYQIRGGAWRRQIARNLSDAAESDLTPRSVWPTREAREGVGGFEATWELWRLLLGLAFVVLCVEFVLAVRRGHRGLLVVLSRGVGLFCLGWALTNPSLSRAADRLNVLFLWDRSASIPFTEQVRAWEFMRAALKSKEGRDTAGLISFAGSARVDVPLSRDPDFTRRPDAPLQGEGTELAGALEAALFTLPSAGQSRIVLLSDGHDSRGKVLSEIIAARERGVEVHALPLGVWREGEVLLGRLSLPREVKEGEAFVLRVIVMSAAESTGRITLSRNGKFLGAQTVRLAAGKNVFAYQQTVRKGGFHVFQASIDAPGDVIEANNRALGVVAVRGRPRVLYAEKDREQARHLLKVLRAQKMAVDLVGPGRIPRDLRTLLSYDTVILSNVSALRLSRAQMELLRKYVRDHGGGLLMLGGEESFGLGGYYHTPVEESLPVTMEARQRLEVPSLAVALVIDRSGSMDTGAGRFTKLELAKEAAQLVVELLDRRSEVGVLAFDTAPSWVVPIQPVVDREHLRYEIATIKSGGGTDVFPAVKEAYQRLFQREARLKHLILLSDGQSAAGDFASLTRRMARDGITVSTVAIGRDADTRLLTDISRWGRGRYYYSDDAQSLPRIFALEAQLASKSAVVEEPFLPVVTAPLHEIVQQIDWRTAPPLGGHVATTARPTAELLLASPQGDPLLAVWRYGLGRSAAFTSDAKARWGVLWLKWKGFPRLFAQLVRWTLRRGQQQELTAGFDRDRDRGVITVEAVDPRGEFQNFLEARVGVIAPDKQRMVLDLTQIAPGRYAGTFPLKGEGVYLVGVMERRGQKTLHSELGSLVLPDAPEHRTLGLNLPVLQEVVGLTGGRLLKRAEEVFRVGRRPSVVSRPIWPYLAAVSLFLFFAEYLSRRLWQPEVTRSAASVSRGATPLPRLVKGRRRS
ncbi:MAG: VWA domain-containing protein [Candidatus Methylomirabilales bacterium]